MAKKTRVFEKLHRARKGASQSYIKTGWPNRFPGDETKTAKDRINDFLNENKIRQ